MQSPRTGGASTPGPARSPRVPPGSSPPAGCSAAGTATRPAGSSPKARRRSARPSPRRRWSSNSSAPPTRPGPARRPGRRAARADVPVSEVTDEALAALDRDRRPAGPGRRLPAPRRAARATPWRAGPRLVAVLAEIRDPGNAGTVLRTADAAGAGAVVFAGDSRRPLQRQVRAGLAPAASSTSTWSARADPGAAVAALRAAGLTVLAATGYGDSDLDDLADDGRLAAPHRLAVRLRGARPARGADRRRRRPGPGADARAGGEPEPGCGRRRLPVRFGQSTALDPVRRRSAGESSRP